MSDEKNFFEKYGCEVQSGEVEVGGIYPIYGMITKFISEDFDIGIIVEVNYNLEFQLSITEQDKLELIKSRSFEPGIFVTKITEKGDRIKGATSTIVFGRKQGYSA